MQKVVKLIFSRAFWTIAPLLLEIYFGWLLISNLGSWGEVIGLIARGIGIVLALLIIRDSRHLSSDLLYLLMIVLAPVAGTILYLVLGFNLFTNKTFRQIRSECEKARPYYSQDPAVIEEVEKKDPEMAGQMRYLHNSGYCSYRNRSFQYYPSGELGWTAMLQDLKMAERYIFLEYFIIQEGMMWNAILEILKEKARDGLDVRVMYDDMGSFQTLPYSYVKQLNKLGIKCTSFNRVSPVLSTMMNHRDHRKIMVIDGRCAWSGGVNLADEYIGRKQRFGEWKDNMMKVEGPAVWSYTVLFLSTWNALHKTDRDYTFFKEVPSLLALSVENEEVRDDGYIAPYGSSPLDGQMTAQNVYENLINRANDYIYITTPYLIIDNDMLNALILAAGRGVDVRIVTPGIPDKPLTYEITRSFYRTLIEGGVRIYEYTPGFIHAKLLVTDDRAATCGTINLDYRSLYLHFENGTLLYKASAVQDIKKDMDEILSRSHELSYEETKVGFWKNMGRCLLRVIAPMF